MKYWYDCEFESNETTIIPISIGIIAEDERQLYLINKEYMQSYIDLEGYHWRGHTSVITPWLWQNVCDQISQEDVNKFGLDHESWGDEIVDFISNDLTISSRDNVELWGWYAAYDHVMLCQTYGQMIDLPEPIPMFTNEIEQLRNGAEELERDLDKFPLHNALSDAKYQRALYNHWLK